MSKKELLDNFYKLLKVTKSEREDIDISLSMFKRAIDVLAELNIRSAKEIIECYEGNLKYFNFLTESEAENIIYSLVNQDGTKGAKWRDSDEVFRKVESIGGNLSMEPYYNKWALYVTLNKFASDQSKVILKWVGEDKDKYFEACYDLALSQLQDRDRPNWIRPYYNLEV